MHQASDRWRAVWIGAAAMVAVTWGAITYQMAMTLREWGPIVRLANEHRVLPQVGTFVPAWPAVVLDGSALTLGEATEGRSQVFIGIQAACPLCREMMPQLRAIADSLSAFGEHDVVWLSLSSRDSTAAYVAEHGIKQPFVLLPDERTSVLNGIRAVPTIVVVDGGGRIRYRHAGRFRSAAAVDSVRQMALAATEVWRRPAPRPDSTSLGTSK